MNQKEKENQINPNQIKKVNKWTSKPRYCLVLPIITFDY